MLHIRVPSERIGAIIGPNGETKQMLEEWANAHLDIDSETGSVTIKDQEDPVAALRLQEIIKAIGRGFSPERATRLMDDEHLMLEIIDLSKVTSTSNDMRRLKGRIIGRDGKTREIMENLTNTSISIYGKTVGIIGYPEQIKVARDAIDMLIDGAPHGPVYSYLERKRKEMKRAELDYY